VIKQFSCLVVIGGKIKLLKENENDINIIGIEFFCNVTAEDDEAL
jgi:hypothetical protein